jgi:hypothetical protein
VKSLCVVLRIIIVCGFCVDVQCATEGRNGDSEDGVAKLGFFSPFLMGDALE